MKNVTLKEVAKEAGVSVMSVSKALNNKEGLSDETAGGSWRSPRR